MNISQGDLAVVARPGHVRDSQLHHRGRAVPRATSTRRTGPSRSSARGASIRAVLERAASRGYRFVVGFEGEFHLVRREEGRVVRVDNFFTHSQEAFNVYQPVRSPTWSARSARSTSRRPRDTSRADAGNSSSTSGTTRESKPADDIVYFKDATKADRAEARLHRVVHAEDRPRLVGQRDAPPHEPRQRVGEEPLRRPQGREDGTQRDRLPLHRRHHKPPPRALRDRCPDAQLLQAHPAGQVERGRRRVWGWRERSGGEDTRREGKVGADRMQIPGRDDEPLPCAGVHPCLRPRWHREEARPRGPSHRRPLLHERPRNQAEEDSG